MEIIKAIFKFGHFYDPQTNKRILIREGAEAGLVLEKPDQRGLPTEHPVALRSSNTLFQKLKDDSNVQGAQLVKSAGECLYFRFTIEYKKEGDEFGGKYESFLGLKKEEKRFVHYKFEVELLEDLYFYLTDKGKIQTYDCACKLKREFEGDIGPFFEPLFANSLTDIYRNTVVHYFAYKRSGSNNAFESFYADRGCEKRDKLEELREAIKGELKVGVYWRGEEQQMGGLF